MVYLEPTRRQFRIDQSLFSSIFLIFLILKLKYNLHNLENERSWVIDVPLHLKQSLEKKLSFAVF